MVGMDSDRVAAVRSFNRFYTRRIGVLEEGLLHSPYSLTEVRVLYELAHHDGLTARDLARDLSLDNGYLSRILQRFVRQGLVRRDQRTEDGRERPLALVAHIAAEFVEKLDRKRERCWIAERDGARVGCVFVVKKTKEIAKLRLLIVDPRARGSGLGQLLVRECIRFARECGYRKMTLWTQQNLAAARHIYKSEGFTLVASEPHAMFGVELVGETWELSL